ncbi:hypothetical protein BV25DRAFT_1827943 [Artomyces pyxidatus]|uniref:Uncharacterized protein n=1 Tax=Artomyces pyxidatus TaxID=48021 RepID=A0ACB8SV16_9AGAM|nr:hypothetical protein BV25DRAFT_1827943 [Artomyces pyxidatus]
MPPTYANSTEPLPIWERAGPAPIRGLAREAIFGIVFMIGKSIDCHLLRLQLTSPTLCPVVFAFIILAFFWVANGMQRPRPLSVLAAEAKGALNPAGFASRRQR